MLLGFGCFSLWFKSSRVTIEATGVRAVTRCLFFGRNRQFATGDITRFETSNGMTSGSRVFLDIRLIPRNTDDSFTDEKTKYQLTGQRPPLRFSISDPRGITVASGIASAAEAKWLTQEMNRALGRPA